MERKPNCKNRIIKTGRLPWKTTNKLGQSKEIHGKSTREYKETIWQEKKKLLRAKSWRKYVVRS